jgi:hypothetical protein
VAGSARNPGAAMFVQQSAFQIKKADTGWRAPDKASESTAPSRNNCAASAHGLRDGSSLLRVAV